MTVPGSSGLGSEGGGGASGAGLGSACEAMYDVRRCSSGSGSGVGMLEASLARRGVSDESSEGDAENVSAYTGVPGYAWGRATVSSSRKPRRALDIGCDGSTSSAVLYRLRDGKKRDKGGRMCFVAGATGEVSREPDGLVGSAAAVGRGVRSSDGPKKSALRERAGACCSMRGVSSAPRSTSEVVNDDVVDACDLTEIERFGGFGGGSGVGEPSKGEPKNAWVLLPIEATETEGDGSGEGMEAEAAEEIDEDEERTLRWE